MTSVINSYSPFSPFCIQVASDAGRGCLAGGAAGMFIVVVLSGAEANDSFRQMTQTAIRKMPPYFHNDLSEQSNLYPLNDRISSAIVFGCMVIGTMVGIAMSITGNKAKRE